MDEEGWRRFLQVCLRAKSPQRLNALLRIFLTSEERSAVAKRALIVRELLKGKMTQREMAQDLEVSIAKITRGSNELKEVEETLKEFLKKSL